MKRQLNKILDSKIVLMTFLNKAIKISLIKEVQNQKNPLEWKLQVACPEIARSVVAKIMVKRMVGKKDAADMNNCVPINIYLHYRITKFSINFNNYLLNIENLTNMYARVPLPNKSWHYNISLFFTLNMTFSFFLSINQSIFFENLVFYTFFNIVSYIFYCKLY